VKYRDAQLRIVIKGHGTAIRQFKLDGKTAKPWFPASQPGAHEIEIVMK
jgi:hypothetical protein